MKYDSIKTPQYTCSMYTNLMILQFEVVESMVKSFLYIFFVWSNRKKIYKHIYYLLMCHYFILRPLYCILGGLGQKKSRRRGYYYGTLWKVLGWGRVLSPPFDTAKICFDPFHIGHAQMVIRQMKVKSTLNQKKGLLEE